MIKRNTAWQVTASTPLLRPGLTITIVTSEKYTPEETLKLLEMVRKIDEMIKINEAAKQSTLTTEDKPKKKRGK